MALNRNYRNQTYVSNLTDVVVRVFQSVTAMMSFGYLCLWKVYCELQTTWRQLMLCYLARFSCCARGNGITHIGTGNISLRFVFLFPPDCKVQIWLFMDCWEEGVSDLETCFKMFPSLWTHIFFFPPPHLPFCFAAIDLLYGGIYCFMCQDYIYDKDMEQIAKEEQRKAWKLQGLVFLPEFLVSVFNHTCPSHLSMAKKQ